MHRLRPVGFLVQVQVTDGGFNHALLVVVIINDEIRIEGQVFGFTPQQAGADGMKCAQPETV